MTVTMPDAVERGGVEILRALARGIIDLGSQNRLSSFTLPYPASAQRALDQVVFTCLAQEHTPPQGIPELVFWCRARALSAWPLALPPDLIGPEIFLVDDRVCLPTQTCAEWASDGPSGVMEQQAQALLRDVMAGCSSRESYQACRDFLISRPVLTRQDVTAVLASPRDGMAWNRVKHLYSDVPDAYILDGRFAVCPTCQSLAIPPAGGGPWCESEACPRSSPIEPTYEAVTSQVLRNPLRVFVGLPGRTEQTVRRELTAVGVDVQILPDDIHRYRLTWPSGETWTMQVHDRVQPAMLATKVNESATSAGDGRTFVVVPKRVMIHRPNYRSVFERLTPPHTGIELVTDDELVRLARSPNDHNARRRDDHA
ncbi:MAG: hypothetical protein JO115_11570 [Pseudonocardiales bacterium]|nr:hypothetical protein [Pseudonocardiales bacterium]